MLTVLSAVLLTGCNEADQPAWFDKGQAKAEERWNSVRGEVRLSMARDALNQGHAEEAAAQLAMIPSDLDLAGLALLKAEIAVARGEWTTAEATLRKIIAETVGDVRAYYLLGVVLEQDGRPAEAAEEYREAAALAPMHTDAVLATAECLMSASATGAALNWLMSQSATHRTLNSNPAYHLLMAEAHRMLGEWDAASIAYMQAIQLGADDAHTFSRAADAFVAQGRYREALEWIDPLEQNLDEMPVSLVLIQARCQMETGRADEARRALGVLVRENDDGRVWLMLAEASVRSGNPVAAQRNVERSIRADPSNATAYQMMAALALRSGDVNEAIAAANRAASLQPEDALSHCLLGEAWRETGELDRAAESYQRALELEPACMLAMAALLEISPERAGRARSHRNN